MGMESQLHGPSAFSYQGKGAAFGQINPPLRSLLKSGYSHMRLSTHSLIEQNLGLQSPRFQDKYLCFRGKKWITEKLKQIT